jgi:hypothetical protein
VKPGATLLLAALFCGLPQIEEAQPEAVVTMAPPAEAAIPAPQAARRGTPLSAPSPGARVELLLASADPQDAFRAWRLLERCHLSGNAAVCRGITAAQLRLRLERLEVAARAGVPGAATAFVGQGPFGDKSALTQRPDDPLVAQWIRDAEALIREAARRDDVAAITQLGWLAVHWDMAGAERFSALVASAHEWHALAPERD